MKIYPEMLVARVVGINKARLVDTRRARLQKGPDWDVIDAQVCYTPAGLEKICAALGLDAALAAPAEKSALGAASAAAPGPAAAATGDAPEASAPQREASWPGLLTGALNKVANLLSPASKEGGSHEVTDTANRSAPGPVTFARRDPATTVAEGVEQLAEKVAPVEIEVTRAQLANRTVIQGKRLDNGAQVVVRVRDNTTFVPGLIIRAMPANRQSFFTQIGHPPRWRGDRHGFTRRPEASS